MKINLRLTKATILSISFVLITFFVRPAFSGAKDGGGGNFTQASFWNLVRTEIIPGLENLNTKKQSVLSGEQAKKLIEYMQPQVTRIEMKLDQLYISKNGKSIPVDAVNYPSENLIELYQPSWKYKVNSGMDVNHLILHEFMGLAQIDDEEYRISTTIFPPIRLPISFAANKVNCSSSVKYILVKKGSWHVRDMPVTSYKTLNLSQPKRLNKNPKCVSQNVDSSQCLKYANDYWIKSAEARFPLEFDMEDTPSGKYVIDVTINFLSSYYGYGWGAARNTLFQREAKFEILWKLIFIDKQNKERVLTILTQEKESTDDYSSKTTLTESIPVPEFIETISQNGFQLSTFPYQGEVTSLFHSYNIVGFLEEKSSEAGNQTTAEKDDFIINKILKGMKGNALPFRVYVSCSLDSE